MIRIIEIEYPEEFKNIKVIKINNTILINKNYVSISLANCINFFNFSGEIPSSKTSDNTAK